MGRKKVDVTKGDINIVNRAIARGLDDGSPRGHNERIAYCAQVVGAFTGFLKVRLEYMIRQQEAELRNPMGAREQDLFHKGSINAFSLLLDWGDEIQNEYTSYGPKKEVNQNTPDEAGGGEIISSVI
jgi:hypothetical protein